MFEKAYIINPRIIDPETGEFIGFGMDRLTSYELYVLDMLKRGSCALLVPVQELRK